MTNERRWGDLEARKTIVLDYKLNKIVKNNGHRDGAFVPNHHEGIVTRDIAKAANAISTSKHVRGVPDIKVIENGTLKGFVCINPCFDGIDRYSLMKASWQAYTQEEYLEVLHEAKVLNGEEKSKITPFEFSGYFVPYSAHLITNSTPTLTITRTQIKLNKKSVEFFGNESNIEFLYHPLMQALVIRSCDSESGLTLSKESDTENFSTHEFSNVVYETMDWIKDLNFRFRGIKRVRGDKKALIFYLDEPQILSNKASKELAKKVSEDAKRPASIYIPYKNSELNSDENELELKRKQRAVNNYSIRKKRDKICDVVTRDDLNDNGVIVKNLFIGNIPTKEEVEMEVETLLMSM